MRTVWLLFLAIAIGCSTTTAEPAPNKLKSLTVDEVATRIAAHDGKTYVYDNNPKESWVARHVPTATWLDDEQVTAAALPKDKAATLIFYCHNES